MTISNSVYYPRTFADLRNSPVPKKLTQETVGLQCGLCMQAIRGAQNERNFTSIRIDRRYQAFWALCQALVEAPFWQANNMPSNLNMFGRTLFTQGAWTLFYIKIYTQNLYHPKNSNFSSPLIAYLISFSPILRPERQPASERAICSDQTSSTIKLIPSICRLQDILRPARY